MFEPIKDYDSFEAPPALGQMLDANGMDWNSRSDNVIDKEMSHVKLRREDYWQYKKYLNARQWFELDLFLDRLFNKADDEDKKRISNAKKVIMEAQNF